MQMREYRVWLIVAAAGALFSVPGATQTPSASSKSLIGANQETPPWAYPVPAAGLPRPADDGTPKHLNGSDVSYTLAQLRDLFLAKDWFPNEHPPMPEVVAQGRKPDVYACGMCHLPNGQGRPENASLAGLPVDYIVQQMSEFKSGARKSSESKLLPASLMAQVGQNANDADVRAAAEYFANLKYKPWIKVIEAKRVPTCGRLLRARAMSRSAIASSKCPRIWPKQNCVIPHRDSSPTCRWAASRKARS
jgi:cytochrome c553